MYFEKAVSYMPLSSTSAIKWLGIIGVGVFDSKTKEISKIIFGKKARFVIAKRKSLIATSVIYSSRRGRSGGALSAKMLERRCTGKGANSDGQ